MDVQHKATSLGQGRAQRLSDPILMLRSLYADNHTYVRRLLYWMVPSEQVDDLVQDVFFKIWKNLKLFRDDSEVKTWVYRITMNTAFDYLRRSDHSLHSQGEGDSRTESGKSQVVMQELVHKGVRCMAPKHRSVFIMFYKEELSIEEIAKILSISESMVKARLHNAKELFREFMQKNWGRLWKEEMR